MLTSSPGSMLGLAANISTTTNEGETHMPKSIIAALHMTVEREVINTVSVLIHEPGADEYAAYRHTRFREDMETRSLLLAAGDAFEHGWKLAEAEARKAFTKELEGKAYRR